MNLARQLIAAGWKSKALCVDALVMAGHSESEALALWKEAVHG